ncbi:MAG: hypothetical protein V9G19_11475 [Tetrasphaera sp.]
MTTKTASWPTAPSAYSGAQIDAVGASADLLAAYPDDERWDAHGLVLMPGQICAHTHFYGAFARGMYIPGPPAKDFPEILELALVEAGQGAGPGRRARFGGGLPGRMPSATARRR